MASQTQRKSVLSLNKSHQNGAHHRKISSESTPIVKSAAIQNAALDQPQIIFEPVTQRYHEFIWRGEVKQKACLIGSFDGWKEQFILEKAEGAFRVLLALEPGIYFYKFIIDDIWMHDASQPSKQDESGNINNVVKIGFVSSSNENQTNPPFSASSCPNLSELSNKSNSSLEIDGLNGYPHRNSFEPKSPRSGSTSSPSFHTSKSTDPTQIHTLDPSPTIPGVHTSSASMLSFSTIGHVPPNYVPQNIPIGWFMPEEINSLPNKMQLYQLYFKARANLKSIKQTNSPLWGSVRWDLSPLELKRHNYMAFMIDLPKVQFIDQLDIDVGLIRAWLGWFEDELAHDYSISISYHSNIGWTDFIRKYSLLHLIASAPNANPEHQPTSQQNSTLTPSITHGPNVPPSDNRLRRGSLNVGIRAQKLCVVLHCDPRPAKSISRSSSFAVVNDSQINNNEPSILNANGQRKSSNPLDRPSLSKSNSITPTSWRKNFVFSGEHFDRNGLLYWLGTNEGRDKLWQNPTLTGKLRLEISHSKLIGPNMRKLNIVARHSVEPTFWGGSAPLWFMIDLGQYYRFSPNYYTLRHGHSSANSYICDWVFQGSNDANDWVTLHSQIEPPFVCGFDVKSFAVPECPEMYRYFRIMQKGNYSMGIGESGGSPYLCVSGFEMYGELGTAPAKPAANIITSLTLSLRSLSHSSDRTKAQKFEHVQDFDTNGILYHIATNGGTEPYINPSQSGRVKLEISHPELYNPDMSKHNIISRSSPAATFWGGTTPQWFTVDLSNNNWVKATAYTLRHGYTAANSFLRDWEFSGSVDGQNWTTLHVGHDSPFTKGFDTETFVIKDCPDYFRYFRVLQKGNYSMGTSNSLGSPYMCISGFELYGELTGMRSAPESAPDYVSVQMRRATRQAYYTNRQFHRQLIKAVQLPNQDEQTQLKFLDILIDIWTQNLASVSYLIDELDLSSFVKNCILNSSKQICLKAGHLLGNAMLLRHPNDDENVTPTRRHIILAEKLLEVLLELLPNIAPNFSSVHALNTFFDLLIKVWDKDPLTVHSACMDALQEISQLIYNHRNPYYNILRTHFGLYGYVFEPELFTESLYEVQDEVGAAVDNSASNSSSHNPSHPGALSSSLSSMQSESFASISTRKSRFNSKDLFRTIGFNVQTVEGTLRLAQQEFYSKCQNLMSLLESISIYGKPYESYHSEVLRRYNQCLRYQKLVSTILRRLAQLSPKHPLLSHSLANSKIERWDYTAERLLYYLNLHCGNASNVVSTPEQNLAPHRRRASIAAQFQHSMDYLMSIFNVLCVYTTPAVRAQAIQFLAPELGNQVSFPTSVLRKFFATSSYQEQSLNLFPEEDVFRTMVDIMAQDRLRFVYIDSLFDLLSEITNTTVSVQSSTGASTSSKSNPSSHGLSSKRHLQSDQHSPSESTDAQIDIKLLSWALLLLSTITKTNNDPPHQGSKCKACSMAPIRGVRYRCVNCADYDLCASCEADLERQHDIGHVFVKISKPLPLAPSTLRGPPAPKEPLLPNLLYQDLENWPSSLLYAKSPAFGTPTVHNGISCNNCRMTSIIGTRYMCCQCDNYNLCESCEAKVNHLPMHLFLKILHPLPPTKPDSSPRALIPVVLHKGFYSYTQPLPSRLSHLKSLQNPHESFDPNQTSSIPSSIPINQMQSTNQQRLYLQSNNIEPKQPLNKGTQVHFSGDTSVVEPPSHHSKNQQIQNSNASHHTPPNKKSDVDDLRITIHPPTFSNGGLQTALPKSSDTASHSRVIIPENAEIKVTVGSPKTSPARQTAFSDRISGSKQDSSSPHSSPTTPVDLPENAQNDFRHAQQLNTKEESNNTKNAGRIRGSVSNTSFNHPTLSPLIKPTGLQHNKTERSILSHIRYEEEEEYQSWLQKQAFLARQRWHLRSTFQVLYFSTLMQPMSSEIFFLASRVLIELAKQQCPEDIIEDILGHPKFEVFLERVCQLDPLIRSAVLHLFETLFNNENYPGRSIKELTSALRNVKSIVRNKVVKMLVTSSKAPQSNQNDFQLREELEQHFEGNCFLYELFLIVSSEEDYSNSAQMQLQSERSQKSFSKSVAPSPVASPMTKISLTPHVQSDNLNKKESAAQTSSQTLIQPKPFNPTSKTFKTPGIMTPNSFSPAQFDPISPQSIGNQNIGSASSSSTESPISGVKLFSFPLDELSSVILEKLSLHSVNSGTAARHWCIGLRLLKFINPVMLIQDNLLYNVFSTAIKTPSEYQSLILNDFCDFLNTLSKSSSTVSNILNSNLLNKIIKDLPHVAKEKNIMIYLACLELATHSALRKNSSVSVEQVSSFLTSITLIMGDASKFYCKSNSENQLIHACLTVVLKIVTSIQFTTPMRLQLLQLLCSDNLQKSTDDDLSNMESDHESLAIPNISRSSTASRIIAWLSNSKLIDPMNDKYHKLHSKSSSNMKSHQSRSKNDFNTHCSNSPALQTSCLSDPSSLLAETKVEYHDVKSDLLSIVDCLAAQELATKQILQLCLSELQLRLGSSNLIPSVVIPLLKTPDIKSYFINEMQGGFYLLNQLNQIADQENPNLGSRLFLSSRKQNQSGSENHQLKDRLMESKLERPYALQSSSFLPKSLISTIQDAAINQSNLKEKPPTLTTIKLKPQTWTESARKNVNSSSSFIKISTQNGMDNLNAYSRILEPTNDILLCKLLSEDNSVISQHSSQSTVWIHHFCKDSSMISNNTSSISPLFIGSPSSMTFNSSDSISAQVSIFIEFKIPCILRKIRLEFIKNYLKHNTKTPHNVMIETGSTRGGLLPVVKAKLIATQSSTNQPQSSHTNQSNITPTKEDKTVSDASLNTEPLVFELNQSEVVKFLRISMIKPKNGTSIAISKLTLLGHSSLIHGNTNNINNQSLDQNTNQTQTTNFANLQQLSWPLASCQIPKSLQLQQKEFLYHPTNDSLNKTPFEVKSNDDDSTEAVIPILQLFDHCISDNTSIMHHIISNNDIRSISVKLIQLLCPKKSNIIQSLLFKICEHQPDLGDFLLQKLMSLDDFNNYSILVIHLCTIQSPIQHQKHYLDRQARLISFLHQKLDTYLNEIENIRKSNLDGVSLSCMDLDSDQESMDESDNRSDVKSEPISKANFVSSYELYPQLPPLINCLLTSLNLSFRNGVDLSSLEIPKDFLMSLLNVALLSNNGSSLNIACLSLLSFFCSININTFIGIFTSYFNDITSLHFEEGFESENMFASKKLSILAVLGSSSTQCANYLIERRVIEMMANPLHKLLLFDKEHPDMLDSSNYELQAIRKQITDDLIHIRLIFLRIVSRNDAIRAYLGKKLFDTFLPFLTSDQHGSQVSMMIRDIVVISCQLNAHNKAKFAHLLNKSILNAAQISSPDSQSTVNRNQVLQTILPMVSIQEKIAVFLEPSQPTFNNFLIASKIFNSEQYVVPQFDANNSHSDLVISEDRSTLSSNSFGQHQRWRTAICSNLLSNGIFYWEIKLEKVSSSSNVIIGVCEPSHDLSSWIGQSSMSQGWGFYGAGVNKGYLYHSGIFSSNYGKTMAEGDVVGVLLDLIDGNISYSINGQFFGIAYSNLAHQQVCPAISIYDKSDVIKFVSPIYCMKPNVLSCGDEDVGIKISKLDDPRLFHRHAGGALLEVNLSTTIKSLKKSILGSIHVDLNKNLSLQAHENSLRIKDQNQPKETQFKNVTDLEIEYHLGDGRYEKIEDDQLSFASLVKLTKLESDILDLRYSLVYGSNRNQAYQQSNNKDVQKESQANSSQANSSQAKSTQELHGETLLLSLFNQFGCLPQLVDLLIAQLSVLHLEPNCALVMAISGSYLALGDIPPSRILSHAYNELKILVSTEDKEQFETMFKITKSAKEASHLSFKDPLSPMNGKTDKDFTNSQTSKSTESESSSQKVLSKTAQGQKLPIMTIIPIGIWVSWLKLLQMLLGLDGFAERLLQCDDAVSIFLDILSDCQSSPIPAFKVKMENFGKSRKQKIDPSISRNPAQILLNLLNDHLNDSNIKESSIDPLATSKALNLRYKIFSSGALANILSRLSDSTEIQPKDSKHDAFKDYMKQSQQRQNYIDNHRSAKKDKDYQKSSQLLQNGQQNAKQHWAKGTGYGTVEDDQKTSGGVDYLTKKYQVSMQMTTSILSLMKTFFNIKKEPSFANIESVASQKEASRDLQAFVQPALSPEIYDVVNASCLVPLLESYLKNDSLLDMGRYVDQYELGFELVRSMIWHDYFVALFANSNPNNQSIRSCISKLYDLTMKSQKKLSFRKLKDPRSFSPLPISSPQILTKNQPSIAQPSSMISSYLTPISKSKLEQVSTPIKSPISMYYSPVPQSNNDADEQSRIIRQVISMEHASIIRLDGAANTTANPSDASASPSQNMSNEPLSSTSQSKSQEQILEEQYKAELENEQFGEMSILNPEESLQNPNSTYTINHHYKQKIDAETQVSPLKMKRLVNEIGSLSTGLPLHLSSSVFMRVDSDRMDVMKVIITGPHGTPYESGVFMFDIYCPAEYPKVPPLVNLQTTGFGSVRFNPNLYNCGKVCLSLLGTWPGSADEMWQESTSTLLQVLVSIQSLIFVDEPYFNEPGYENTIGTEVGRVQSSAYNENIRLGTLKWAILAPLLDPPTGFEEVVKKHFTIKRILILKNCYKWIKEARSSPTSGYLEKITNLVKEIEAQLLLCATIDLNEIEDRKVDNSTIEEKRWELAASIQPICSQFPLKMHYKALEVSNDQKDAAIEWLYENGELYLQQNPDFLSISDQNPKLSID